VVIVDGNIRLGRVKKWSTQDFRISVEGKKLAIFYRPNTPRTFYTIADSSGKVFATGSISETGTTNCVLQFAAPGNYFINLVDGEDMLKQAIQLS
jgi:hypothetical protein